LENPQTKKTSRRGFLGIAGGALTAGAALAILRPKSLQAAESVTQQHVSYRETQHIKMFYETARF